MPSPFRPGSPSSAAFALDGVEGRHKSYKNVTRLNTNICCLQHRGELLLERMRSMVGGLIGYVLLHTFQLGWTDAERAVTFLPGEEAVSFSHPSAGVCL